MVEIENFHDVTSALFVIFIISIIVALCWQSTQVRERPIIATAIVITQRERRNVTHSESQSSGQNTNTSSSENMDSTNNSSNNLETVGTETTKENVSTSDPLKTSSDNLDISKNDTDEKTVSSSDSDCSVLRKRTIGASALPNDGSCAPSTSGSHDIPDSASETDKLNIQKLPSKEGDSGNNLKEGSSENSINSEIKNVPNIDGERPTGSIRIKLKFLDETQKIVYGILKEEVIAFKRTHFAVEIQNHRVIRLIFNGRLLNQDRNTLEQYGLFEDCVVHCHVSQPRPPTENDNRTQPEVVQDNDDLDVSSILVPSLSGILTILWYLRYEFSHLFNTTTTLIMAWLTILFCVSQYTVTFSYDISLERSGNSNANSAEVESQDNNQRNQGNGTTQVESSQATINSSNSTETLAEVSILEN